MIFVSIQYSSKMIYCWPDYFYYEDDLKSDYMVFSLTFGTFSYNTRIFPNEVLLIEKGDIK